MSTEKKAKTTGKKKVFVDENMRDYSNDPYFVKKRSEAVKFLKEVGIPENFMRKK